MTGVETLAETGFFQGWGGAGSWYVNCVLAVFVVAIINGAIYAIGHALNSQNLKRYAQSEFLQLAATAIIIVVVLQLVILGAQFIGENFGGAINCGGVDVTDPIDAASCRTAERLDYFYKQYENVKEQNYYPEWGYHFTFTLFGVPVFQGSWVPDIYKPVETYHYIASKIVSIMISLNAQMFLLKYIQENMLAFFLPLGIILRAFHFTRGIGGFFIALAISLYFIYPTVLFMMDSGYASAPQVQQPSYRVEGVCNIPMFSGFSLGAFRDATSAGRAAQLSVSISNIASFVSEVFVRIFYENMVALAFALTALRYGTTILGGEAGVFLNVAGRWV